MKIAQVCPYDFSRHGGVKTHIVQLSNELRKQGHEVHIIAPVGAEFVDLEHLHCFGKNFSMPFLGTKIDVNAAVGRERKRLKAYLKQERFDIIHFHTIWNPIIPFQVLRHTRKSKHVATFHDTPKNNLIGRFLGRFVMPFMARLIFTQLEGIISVSETQSKFIRRFSKRKVHIIPNGISAEPSQSKPKHERNKLLFLGRLEPRKGVMSALRAFKIVQKTYPTSQLLIAGEGDQLEMAQEFVTDHELPNVHFLGKVSDDEKWSLFNDCEVYVASAEYGESFGIVLLEAMSRVTLLAGFANEGYKNVLTTEQLQFFTEPADWQSLSEKINDLLSLGEQEKNDLRKLGIQNAQSFSWENLVGQIIQVYQ